MQSVYPIMNNELLCIILPPCLVIMYFCFQTHVVYVCKFEEKKTERIDNVPSVQGLHLFATHTAGIFF